MASDEDLDYRAPVSMGPAAPVSTQDENDYSTLLEVARDFNASMVGLYSDFNAFDLGERDAADLLIQAAARQEAYKILEPLMSKLQTAIEDVKRKHEG